MLFAAMKTFVFSVFACGELSWAFKGHQGEPFIGRASILSVSKDQGVNFFRVTEALFQQERTRLRLAGSEKIVVLFTGRFRDNLRVNSDSPEHARGVVPAVLRIIILTSKKEQERDIASFWIRLMGRARCVPVWRRRKVETAT